MNLKKYRESLIKVLSIEEKAEVLKSVESSNDNVEIWKSIKSRITEKKFEHELIELGYSYNEFNNIIQNTENLSDKIKEDLYELVVKQNWFELLTKICKFYESIDGDKIIYKKRNKSISDCFRLLTEWCIIEIEKNVSLNYIIIDNSIYNKIEDIISAELVNVSVKTIVYEYNETKKDRKKESGRYTIDNFVEEKFSTIEKFLDFFVEYPVLLRRIMQKVKNLVSYITEVLNNIDSEFKCIKEKYMINSNKLLAMEFGLGDSHNLGRTTVIINFEGVKLVYKPHSGELQNAYNEVLMWFNVHTKVLPFYITNDIYRKEYTICEFVEPDICNEKKEIERFYTRIGQQLAILYLIGASDMHCENIIAKGENPVIIDHETLFNNMKFLNDDKNAFDEVAEIIMESVINSGILSVDIKGIDYGALAQRSDDEKIKFWVCTNKDDENIYFEKLDVQLKKNNNLPLLKGKEIGKDGYENNILNGFKRVMECVCKEKESFIDLCKQFKKCEVRIVLQATQNYSELLQYASHPKYMCDMLSLEKLFENLWMQHGKQGRHYKYELMDMNNCDIPIFYAIVNNNSLFTSNRTELADYFSCSSWELFLNRLNNLENNYKLQYTLLQKQLGVLSEYIFEQNDIRSQRLYYNSNENFSLKEMLEYINEMVKSKIIIKNNTVSWINIEDSDKNFYAYTNYLNGTVAFAYYVLHCKKIGIEVDEVIENYAKIVLSMCMKKEKYTPVEYNTYYNGVVANLGLVCEYYERNSDIKVKEAIISMCMFIEAIHENDKEYSVLEMSSQIETLEKAFLLTRDFRIQSLCENIGEKIIKKLHKIGLENISSENFIGIGNVINSFRALSHISSENIFKQIYDELINYVLDDKKWNENGFIDGKNVYTCKDGSLQRLGEIIIAITEKDDKKYRYNEIIKKLVLENNISENDTVWNGETATLKYLIKYLNKINGKDIEVQNKIEKIVYDLYKGLKINGGFRVYDNNYWTSVNYKDGLLGVASALLDYYELSAKNLNM
ncbi:type 2 lanthipeptide synthetase LanM [Lachnospira pectinoschiza]|uniref:Type 2 lantibiotic biosynthesis protein LanM n=1 Tax=Lachnospira pectinoschiza TaxID=28052 RepID=A0A1G9X1U1_9FIRM|nr:type 2 lanthipeptide synthetase LanM [Lachnospira pectinoschiza]SDM90426.1 type 2 lantibiotic biosynthesis protein LanM [Lachnospira pectinoschiza]